MIRAFPAGPALLRLAIALPAAALPATLPVSAMAKVPQVATDIPVVQSLAAMVMGGLGQPVVLMDAGADAHDYQLRPSQAAALEEADLLVWVGPEMTPWLERPASARAPEAALALLDHAATHRRFYAGADGAAGNDHDDDGHDHESADPHAWLDPGNASTWVQAIADALAARDPDNAAAYQANAHAAQERIAGLDADLAAQLAAARGKPLILGHDAYGYLAEHYGLTIAGTVATGDAASPGAARIAALRDIVTGSGAACFLPEVGQPEGVVRMLTEGTSVRVGAALDPEGRALPPGPELYPALMTDIAEAIAGCLQGS